MLGKVAQRPLLGVPIARGLAVAENVVVGRQGLEPVGHERRLVVVLRELVLGGLARDRAQVGGRERVGDGVAVLVHDRDRVEILVLQHVDDRKDHDLAAVHCESCERSFSDERSRLKAHVLSCFFFKNSFLEKIKPFHSKYKVPIYLQ